MIDILKIMKKELDTPVHYSMQELMKTRSKYYNMLSERNDGKSFQVKHYCILDALLNGFKFIFLGRYAVDMKLADVNSYFDDVNYKVISKHYGKEIAFIKATASMLYVYVYDDSGNIIQDTDIGRYLDLAGAGHKKKAVFKNYRNIIYEEYVTTSGYLFNEPTELQHLVSTVLRSEDGQIFLLGNILIRLNPYLRDWGIGDCRKLKEGEIKAYEIDGVKVAVQRCENTAKLRNTGMFFGAARKSIVDGEYISMEYPHLPVKYDDCEILYSLNLVHENLGYVLSVLSHTDEQENTDIFLFVYPTEKYKCKRQIRTDYNGDINQTSSFVILNKGDVIVKKLIDKSRIFYSDNLTGTEFNMIRTKYKL